MMGELVVGVHNDEALRQALKLELGDLDDETLPAGVVQDLADIRQIAVETARSSLADEVLAEALRRRIDEMRERLSRIESARERKRELTLTALRQIGIQKIVEADFTLSVRSSAPVVEVTDELAIPKEFWAPQEPKLNRGALYRALKAGQAVPGAIMDVGRPVIAIRRT